MFYNFQTFCDIKDISYGKENVVISCVNGIDRQYPDYVDYSNQRIPASGVKLNLDPNFLECCDCEDNCRVSQHCQFSAITFFKTFLFFFIIYIYSRKVRKNIEIEHVCGFKSFTAVEQNVCRWYILYFNLVF